MRCIRRVGRRGLAGAVIEGALASAAPYVAVIDADLQHDETLLPRMLAVLRAGETDLVVGSRYLEAAGLDEGLSPVRKAGSQLATALGRKALKAEVTDPVSGFFMIRREVVERVAGRLRAGRLQDPVRHHRLAGRAARGSRNCPTPSRPARPARARWMAAWCSNTSASSPPSSPAT